MIKHITLCGSVAFMDEMKSLSEKLDSFGYVASYPSLKKEKIEDGIKNFTEYIDSIGGVEKVLIGDPVWEMKSKAMLYYKNEIDKSDAVLVCNFEKDGVKNKIGESAFMGMAYAFFTGKKIFILNEPPYESSKIEEILGMTPVFLGGDVEKIRAYLD